MKPIQALGLVLLAAAVTAAAQELHRRMPGLPIPFADNLLGAAIVAGTAYFAAQMASGHRLPLPMLLAAMGYSLGAGIETALSAQAALPSDTAGHLVQIAGVNAVSAGLMMPLEGGGFTFEMSRAVPLVIALLGASWGVQAGRLAPPPETRDESQS